MFIALAALTFGVMAGLKPGPLGVFIIHQTMSKGYWHGLISSLAPLITDGPILLLVLLLTVQVNDVAWFISAVSILGSIYLAHLSYKIFNVRGSIKSSGNVNGRLSLTTAVKINFLNPSPYIFWLTTGSAYILMGTKLEALVFVTCALTSLCVTKFIVAAVIKILAERFNPVIYARMLKLLSLPLLVFSLHLFYSGVSVWW